MYFCGEVEMHEIVLVPILVLSFVLVLGQSLLANSWRPLVPSKIVDGETHVSH